MKLIMSDHPKQKVDSKMQCMRVCVCVYVCVCVCVCTYTCMYVCPVAMAIQCICMPRFSLCRIGTQFVMQFCCVSVLTIPCR